MDNKCDITKLPHHIQQKLCHTRPLYRQGKKLTSVKVALWTCILFYTKYYVLLNNNYALSYILILFECIKDVVKLKIISNEKHLANYTICKQFYL